MSYEMPTIDQVLCLNEAMDNLRGDAELLQEIIEIFVDTGPGQIKCIGEAVAAGDLVTVALVAHALKGGAANVCATDLAATALELERLAKRGTLDGAEALLTRLEARFAEVCEVAAVVNWTEVARNWND